MMKLVSKNLRQRRSFSADNKKGATVDQPQKSADRAERNKTGSSRRLNLRTSLNLASRDPYLYRSRRTHLQVNMGDISTNVSRDFRKPRDHLELKSKGVKLRSDTGDQKLKSSEVKISGKDNLKDVSVAEVKSESSTDNSSDDSCTAWNSKAKQMSVEAENKPTSVVSRQLRDRRHIQTKVQDVKFSVTLRQHPYRRPKRNIVPKKEAAYGLLWKEEAALQRALNASIQAHRHKELPSSVSPSAVCLGQPRLFSSENKSPNFRLSSNNHFDIGEDYAKNGESEIMDEDFGQNFTFNGSDVSHSEGRTASECKDIRTRIRAQRKFASTSQLELLNLTPVRQNSGCQSQKIVNTNGKTEHFLTFLCLRRSSFLPPHLECFKHGESDTLTSFPNSPQGSHGGSSCPGTPVSLALATDVSTTLTASSGANYSTRTTPAKDSNVKRIGSKAQNGRERNSRRSLMFGLKSATEIWRAGQRKLIRGLFHQTSGSKIMTLSPLTSSSSGRPRPMTSDRFEHRKQPVNCHQLAQQRSQVTSGVNGVQRRAKVDTSLKSRLRASTKALTAAVVKEQLMFANRLQQKQMVADSDDEEEEEAEEEKEQSRSVRVTRSHSITMSETKQKRPETKEMMSRTDKDMVKDKKEKMEGRRESSGRRYSTPQSSKKLECSLPLQSAKHIPKESYDDCTKGRSSISSSFSASPASASIFSKGSSLITRNPTSVVCEVPTFHPTREELQDFTVYISNCSHASKDYGMCRIIPPEGWKMDCNISQELRFTPQTQYIHKMTHRWGPNVQQLTCIMHHIESQGGNLEHIPLVGGVETDMVALSQAVETCGGIQQVIDKNKWPKVAEMLRIPTVAKEKSGRLYEIYCRYLLSYDTLSTEEKKKLEEKVLNKRERDPSAFDQPCIVKSRAKTLSDFFCVARNTQSMYFADDPSPVEIQDEYWRLAEERNCHVAVQTGHIDSWQLMSTRSSLSRKKDAASASTDGSNLKSLLRNDRNLLCHLESISGVTEPVLDIGMLFSTLCWSRDPHFLPRLYYLHTGSDVVWYSVPSSDEGQLKAAMRLLTPDLIDSNLSSWLPTESVMLSPALLDRHGVHVYQTIQQQGQFIVIFPQSFAANISCGYNIMEHVNFTFTPEWLQLGYKASQVLEESCEPESFSVEKLLVDLVSREETSVEVLRIAVPLLEDIVMKELDLRKQLLELGLTSRRLSNSRQDSNSSTVDPGGLKCGSDGPKADCDLLRCDVSEKLCFLSMVFNEQNDVAYSLDQAVSRLRRRKNLGPFALLFRFDEFELNEMIEKGQLKISGRRRSPSKRNAASATKCKSRTL